jgi:hypothetical protein
MNLRIKARSENVRTLATTTGALKHAKREPDANANAKRPPPTEKWARRTRNTNEKREPRTGNANANHERETRTRATNRKRERDRETGAVNEKRERET